MSSNSPPTLQERLTHLLNEIPLAKQAVSIGKDTVYVWPKEMMFYPLGRGCAAIINSDVTPYRHMLVDSIVNAKPDDVPEGLIKDLGIGGNKVRNLHELGNPVFDLMDMRARLLYMLVFGKKSAVVDDCWANVFADGEWTMPHAHKRAEGAAVLSLQPTQTGSEVNPSSGQFYIADPRLEQCCPAHKGFVTTPWMPFREQDLMLMVFPGFVTHGVFPHQGEEPRVSVAWNINEHKLPGEVTHDGTLNDWREPNRSE